MRAALDAPIRTSALVLDRILADEGYEATVAADGEEATPLLTEWCPDLVLTDLHMPRVDGRGLLRRIQALRPGTPVIVLSARGAAEAVSLTSGLGASGFLPKPVQVDQLLVRIRDLIGD